MLELDEALDRFHLTCPDYSGGIANHGPMAVEALFALGHRALTQGFVDVYAPRLSPLEGAGRALSSAEQCAALGCRDRFSDWVVTLERELADRSIPDVVQRCAAEWMDGVFAAGTLAWLRVAHALRAAAAADTPARRRELAHALAYWASRFQPLPGVLGARPIPGLTPAKLISETPPLPAALRKPGLLSEQARALEAHVDFAHAMETLDVGRDPDACIHELCVATAELALRHDPHRTAYTHMLTAAAGLRIVCAHLDEPTRARAIGCVTRAIAALHAIGSAPDSASTGELVLPAHVRALAASSDELRYRAACSLDEHLILGVEACLREAAWRPHPRLLEAAAWMIAAS